MNDSSFLHLPKEEDLTNILFVDRLKFRPVNDNPYLHLPQEEDDGEEEDIEMNQM